MQGPRVEQMLTSGTLFVDSRARRPAPGHTHCLVALCSALLLLAGCAQTTQPFDWHYVREIIGQEFPEVPSLTTSDLAALLSADNRPVILLDVREPDEFAVSHLKDAYLVSSVDQAEVILDSAPPDTIVVAYCSVGYRSAALVERLHERGYANATNLEGSLFAWANEGRPVYRGDMQTEHVHPYDEEWGVLLDRELWSVDLVSP